MDGRRRLVAFAAILGLAAVVTTPCALAQETAPTRLYVALGGDDAWSGTLAAPNAAGDDGPLATVARARDIVRRLKLDGLTRPVEVLVRQGVHELREPLVLTPEDSGSADAPITYAAFPGEQVTILGSRAVTGWELWRDGIYRADLKPLGLGGVSFHQLFYKGKRQILARHPDFDPAHPRTGGFIYVDARGTRPAEQFVYEKGTIPFDQWEDISQAEVWTVFGLGWNFALTPILNVDAERRLITTRRVRRPYEAMNRYFIQNVLGALDAPGEWFLDRDESVVYFRPPDGMPGNDDVRVPVLDNLAEIRGTLPYPHGYLHVNYRGSRDDFPMPEDAPEASPVEYINIRGFRLEDARQSAVRLEGARHCEVTGNTVTNVGNVGINLGGVCNAHEEVGNPRVVPAEGFSGGVGGGGQNIIFNDPCENCRVEGNDVFSVGADGIFLYGTGNVAQNNHVYNSGLVDKDCACISLWGEQNVARRNSLHDVPRNAVFLKGIENVVELNDIHHTMLETCDGGAIRMCQRNLTIGGNIIRHNSIIDTIGYGYPSNSNVFMSPYYSWGIYLDDFTCATTVYGNIIARTGRGGVMVHGGDDNKVENNVIVDAGSYQFEQVPIGDDKVSGTTVHNDILVCDAGAAYTYRCTRWSDKAVDFDSNVVWTRGGEPKIDLGVGGKRYDNWAAWQADGYDGESVISQPGFLDEAADDYRLSDDSPAWKLGFKRIPMEQIGCFEAPERASWPLAAADVIREEPILHEAPVKPVDEDFELDVPGSRPRNGDVADAPEARISITAEMAAEGKHSLKFVDAPGLRNSWLPRIFYPLSYKEGEARFRVDLLLDGKQPPRLYIDPRQYSDTGPVEYFSGPMVTIDQDGSINAGGKRVGAVPHDEWFRLELVMKLGEDAGTSSEMIVTVRGGEPQRSTVPHGKGKFSRLERVVISSVGEVASVFYADNIWIGPAAEGTN